MFTLRKIYCSQLQKYAVGLGSARMGGKTESTASVLADAIDDCEALIDAAVIAPAAARTLSDEPLSSLLEQCEDLTRAMAGQHDTVRTLHHFACTGGTLIAKCLASMPNTYVFSEVEPHSTMPQRYGKSFFPTDLIQLLRVGNYPWDEALLGNIFLNGVEAIYQHASNRGLRLLFRDHAHSRYCWGERPLDAPSLLDDLRSRFQTKSVVTVRDPIDSYLSLCDKQWWDFSPSTFDEYCHRYDRFLSDMQELPVVSYESFVDRPGETMKSICDALELPFNEQFAELFSAHRLSGDSGRSSPRIGKRERRIIPETIQREIDDSIPYQQLAEKWTPKIGHTDKCRPGQAASLAAS